jgi:hypothetical protein
MKIEKWIQNSNEKDGLWEHVTCIIEFGLELRCNISLSISLHHTKAFVSMIDYVLWNGRGWIVNIQ